MPVNLKHRTKVVACWLRDRFWPLLENEPNGTRDEDIVYTTEDIITKDVDRLKVLMELLKTEIATENERNKIVEGKLQSLLAFNTVAIGIITILITFLTAKTTTTLPPKAVASAVVLAGYIALQLFRTIWASIKGLQRREYTTLTIESIISLDKWQTNDMYYKNLLIDMCECLKKNYPVIDDKVNQMAVAHVSILNAIFGLIILLLLIVTAVVCQLLG